MTTPKRKRTRQEQQFWDVIFQDRFPACMKNAKRAAAGCAQLAREQADLALTERRNSQSQDR